MHEAAEERDARERADINLKVHVAQIQQLYKQTWVGLSGTLVVILMVSIALWDAIPHGKLLLWTGASVLIVIIRGLLTAIFQRKAPTGPGIYRWARLHVISVSVSALLWTVASLFLWPENSPVHQQIWPICIVALSASAVAMYCTWTPSYVSYLILSVLPISLRLLSENGVTYRALGLLGLQFVLVLMQTGRIMHAATYKALVMGIRNEALSLFLAEEKAKEEELNRELQKAHDQLNQLSMTDELTGLWNRRFLNATIPEDVAQVVRSYHNVNNGAENRILTNIDIGFYMIDLDHFKRVNDTYGHSAGDEVLKQIKQLLIEHSRGTDKVIRLGGEEFLVVARNCRRSDYRVIAEKILQAVKDHPFDIGMDEPLHLTCSIGAAVFPFLSCEPEVLSWDRVIGLADTCLYAAKRSGRNAWIGIISTELATIEDINADLAKNLPNLIQEGKLIMKTNFPDDVAICWPD